MQVIDQTMRDYHNKNKEAAENNQRQSAVRKCIRSKSCQFYVLFRSKKIILILGKRNGKFVL